MEMPGVSNLVNEIFVINDCSRKSRNLSLLKNFSYTVFSIVSVAQGPAPIYTKGTKEACSILRVCRNPASSLVHVIL